MDDELESTLKERQIEAAQRRAEFWKIWADETDIEENRKFYKRRVSHWLNTIKALELES